MNPICIFLDGPAAGQTYEGSLSAKYLEVPCNMDGQLVYCRYSEFISGESVQILKHIERDYAEDATYERP